MHAALELVISVHIIVLSTVMPRFKTAIQNQLMITAPFHKLFSYMKSFGAQDNTVVLKTQTPNDALHENQILLLYYLSKSLVLSVTTRLTGLTCHKKCPFYSWPFNYTSLHLFIY